MGNGVTRFLVSGTDKQLLEFHLNACWLLNSIERRGQTVLYMCMGEDRDVALEVGRKSGVTMQEDTSETGPGKWAVVVQGEHPGWVPPKRKRQSRRRRKTART